MALDQWQARQIAQTRQGHLDAMITLAANAAEYARYVERDARKGTPGHFTGDLLTFARTIASHALQIGVIDQMLTIAATEDSP
jgi:hypothetical protein